MRVLITGGAGFIGGALARAYLARGDSVSIVDSLCGGRREHVPRDADLHHTDITNGAALERVFDSSGPFDLVSHHAALKNVRTALARPAEDAHVNIVGTLNVLQCAARSGAGRFVFASSAAVYGHAANIPTRESEPLGPCSPYGIAKAAAEAYCRHFSQGRGLRTVVLRYSSVYGPAATEESEAGVITIFARRLLAGQPPTIYGDGEQTRDFVHVDDVVRANLAAGDTPLPLWSVYNVGTGVETSVRSLCAQLSGAIGTDLAPLHAAAKHGEVLRNAQSIDLIQQDLGWSPRVLLIEGLSRLLGEYGMAPARS